MIVLSSADDSDSVSRVTRTLGSVGFRLLFVRDDEDDTKLSGSIGLTELVPEIETLSPVSLELFLSR